MNLQEDDLLNEQDDHSAQPEQDGVEEKQLKNNSLFGTGEMQEVHEGQPMGGHNFNEDGNPIPTGDDKDNPSRNAGYTNGYFKRTEPSEENTADNNFKAPSQEGEPDYDQAQPKANVPGPQELPEQQRVGGDANKSMTNNEDRGHIDT